MSNFMFTKSEAKKNMILFDKELERLHKLLTAKVDYDIYKQGIEDEIKKINKHMICISQRYSGMEY